jgi:hypothetical protein
MAIVVSWDTITISMSKTGARSSILISAVAGVPSNGTELRSLFYFYGGRKESGVNHDTHRHDGGATD